MNTSEDILWGHIKEFRRKFYVNRIMRGGIALLLLMSSVVFLSVTGEGLLGFSSGVRTGLFYVLSLSFVGVALYTVAWPLSKLLNLSKPLTDTEVASLVRRHFPEIDDKLLNLLELRSFASGADNALLAAAIQKKTEDLAPIPFARAINLNVNWKLARYLGDHLVVLQIFLVLLELLLGLLDAVLHVLVLLKQLLEFLFVIVAQAFLAEHLVLELFQRLLDFLGILCELSNILLQFLLAFLYLFKLLGEARQVDAEY